MDKMLGILQALFPDGNAQATGASEWKFKKGSAQIRVKLIKTPNDSWFLVDSEVMKAPKQNLLRFYQKLLELNGAATFGAAFSLRGDVVLLSMLRPVEGLEPEEIKSIVTIVAEMADKYDDELLQLFKN